MRIRAFANEKLCFYMHKNGHFMTKLDQNLNRIDQKKFEDKIMLQKLKLKY